MPYARVGTWAALIEGITTIGENEPLIVDFGIIVAIGVLVVVLLIVVRLLLVHRDRAIGAFDKVRDKGFDFDFLDALWRLEDWFLTKFDKLMDVFDL